MDITPVEYAALMVAIPVIIVGVAVIFFPVKTERRNPLPFITRRPKREYMYISVPHVHVKFDLPRYHDAGWNVLKSTLLDLDSGGVTFCAVVYRDTYPKVEAKDA